MGIRLDGRPPSDHPGITLRPTPGVEAAKETNESWLDVPNE